MALHLKWVDSAAERAAIYALRHEVFVLGQGVPADIERDELDDTADHMIALDERQKCVATGRLVLQPDGTAKVGRMAVHAGCRNRGLGGEVLAALEQRARERGASEVILHAQLSAGRFYLKNGYARRGEVFEEAGIDHVPMGKVLNLASAAYRTRR